MRLEEEQLRIMRQDLTARNTLGLKSLARSFFLLESYDQLHELSSQADKSETILILGGGSNVILPPIVSSLVIKVALRGLRYEQDVSGELHLMAEAGEPWHDIVEATIRRGRGGLENLALIPGSMGAAPVQNIGAYGVELSEFVVEVTAWNLQRREFVVLSGEDCNFDTVTVSSNANFTALRTEYADLRHESLLSQIPQLHLTAQDVFNAVCRIRSAKLPDPACVGNVGSFFQNPIVSQDRFERLVKDVPDLVSYPAANGSRKLAAAWLIDKCGGKILAVGGASIHKTQALVIINQNNASFDDIMELATMIQQKVNSRYGVHLQIEPRLSE